MDAPSRHRINFSWLLKLRWAAAAGQLVTIFFVQMAMQIDLPVADLLSIVALAVMSNGLLSMWFRREERSGRWARGGGPSERFLCAVMVLDVLLLTALLFVCGGPSNPFTVFYIANLSLAAVMLRPRWLWSVTTLVFLCYGFLFFQHRPLAALGDFHEPWLWRVAEPGARQAMRLLVEGEFIAFTAVVSISIYFMTRVTGELALRDRDLRRARYSRAQSEKLEALSTLAAGAAHELASPLSTIAVIARELELHLERGDHLEDAVAESNAVRRDVDRCREILDQMAAGAGETIGEELVYLRVEDMVDECLSNLSSRERIDVDFGEGVSETALFAPRTALARALRSLLKNALDASGDTETVSLQVVMREGHLRITIVDRGSGMTPEVLKRVGDPFFTTKEPGAGMGLGLFITRAVIERLGGVLKFQSIPGQGTTACVDLPHPGDDAIAWSPPGGRDTMGA